MKPEEARRQALIHLGDIGATRHAYRERNTIPSIENLFRDMRYSLRSLRRSPEYVLKTVLSSAAATIVDPVKALRYG